MKALRIAAIVAAAVIIIIQFIRPDRSIVSTDGSSHIATAFPLPDSVDQVLARACNDCHTNSTRYPWYSEIQPVGWWIQDHIDDARRHLNFDEFTSYELAKQYHKLQEVESEVREEMMPLESYLPMHPEARLTPEDRMIIVSWSQALRDSMRAWYPQDSLQRRRPTPETRTDSTETSS